MPIAARWLASTLAVGALLALAGCSRAPVDPVAAARAERAAGQLQAALVLLKEALQREDRPAWRAELGRTLLATGDATGAVLELRKAQAGGSPPDEVLPALAQALLASGDARAVAQDLGHATLQTPAARTELATLRAEALAHGGEFEAAGQSLQSALSIDARHAPARRLQARLQGAQGQADAALATLQALLADDPADALAWLLRGQLLQATGRPAAEAVAAWTTALQHQPRLAAAHTALLDEALARGDAQATQQRLHAARRALAPLHPAVLLAQGRLALLQGDTAAARQAAQPLLKAAPGDPGVLLLAGTAEWRAGATSAALSLLAKAVAASGTAAGPRLLLAQVHLQAADPDAALQTLGPLLAAPATRKPGAESLPPDAARLQGAAAALAGQAELQRGRLPAAQAWFEQAAQADPNEPRHALGRVLALLGRDRARGLAELKALAAKDSSGVADHALAAALVRAGDLDGALRAVAAFDAKHPRASVGPMMRGQLLLERGDRGAARQAFDTALERSPQLLPATLALAELDLRDDHAQRGIERLSNWLAAPDRTPAARVQASLALAQAQAAAGLGAGKLRETLQSALQQAQGLPLAQQLPPHLALGRHLLQTNRADEALALVQALTAAHPAASTEPPVQALHARALLAAGRPHQAAQAWRQRLAAEPRNPEVMVALAQAHAAAGEASAARDRLQQALALDPARLGTLQALVTQSLDAKDIEGALQWARQAQARHPRRPEGWQWEGAVLAARQDWAAATAAWRQAQQRGEDADTAMKLHTALRLQGQAAPAAEVLADWQRRHPTDVAVTAHAADGLAAAGDHAAAEALYRRLLQRRPQDVRLLNNLAWVRLQQRQPDALTLAEQAAQADPGQPAVLDTWARALAAQGQAQRALEVQKQAVELAPRQPALRLTLAQLALQAGDRKLAREELRGLSDRDPAFARQPEAQALAQALQ